MSEVVIPAVCYNDCNSAYREAELRGKVPSICTPQSAFQTYLAACTICIETNSGPTGSGSPSADIIGGLNDYLVFCEGSPAVTTGGPTGPAFRTRTMTFLGTDSKLSTIAMLTFGTGEDPIGSGPTGSTSSSSSSSLVNSTSSSTRFTAASTGRDIPAETDGAALPPASDTPSKVWIAGPVIGSMAAVFLFLATFFFWTRARRRWRGAVPAEPPPLDPPYDKAQLHSDHLPRPVVHELDSQREYYHELQTREIPRELAVHEMDASQTAQRHTGP